MSYSAAETQIMKSMDRLAKVKQTFVAGISGTTTLWDLADDAHDPDYENTVRGSDLTAIDTKIQNAQIGSWCTSWFTNHNSYFSGTMGYTTGISGWMDGRHVRANEDFGQLYYENGGSRFATKYIFADNKTDNVLGTLDWNGATGTDLSTLSSYFGTTKLALVGSSTIDGSNEIIIDSITLKNSVTGNTATFTDNISVGVSETVAIGGSAPSTITNGSTTTDIVLGNNNGTDLVGFAAGEYVLVVDTSPSGFDYVEYVMTNYFDADTKQITVPKLVHTYSLGTTKVYPCFNQVLSIVKDSSSTATSGTCSVLPVPDRVALLTYA